MRINMGKHMTWLMWRNVWLMQLYMSPWHKRIPYLCIYNYNLKIFWFFNHLFFQMNSRNEIFSFLLWNFQVHKVMKMYNENKIFVTYLSNQSMVSLILCLAPLVPSLVYLKKVKCQISFHSWIVYSFINCVCIFLVTSNSQNSIFSTFWLSHGIIFTICLNLHLDSTHCI